MLGRLSFERGFDAWPVRQVPGLGRGANLGIVLLWPAVQVRGVIGR